MVPTGVSVVCPGTRTRWSRGYIIVSLDETIRRLLALPAPCVPGNDADHNSHRDADEQALQLFLVQERLESLSNAERELEERRKVLGRAVEAERCRIAREKGLLMGRAGSCVSSVLPDFPLPPGPAGGPRKDYAVVVPGGAGASSDKDTAGWFPGEKAHKLWAGMSQMVNPLAQRLPRHPPPWVPQMWETLRETLAEEEVSEEEEEVEEEDVPEEGSPLGWGRKREAVVGAAKELSGEDVSEALVAAAEQQLSGEGVLGEAAAAEQQLSGEGVLGEVAAAEQQLSGEGVLGEVAAAAEELSGEGVLAAGELSDESVLGEVARELSEEVVARGERPAEATGEQATGEQATGELSEEVVAREEAQATGEQATGEQATGELSEEVVAREEAQATGELSGAAMLSEEAQATGELSGEVVSGVEAGAEEVVATDAERGEGVSEVETGELSGEGALGVEAGAEQLSGEGVSEAAGAAGESSKKANIMTAHVREPENERAVPDVREPHKNIGDLATAGDQGVMLDHQQRQRIFSRLKQQNPAFEGNSSDPADEQNPAFEGNSSDPFEGNSSEQNLARPRLVVVGRERRDPIALSQEEKGDHNMGVMLDHQQRQRIFSRLRARLV